MNTAKRKYKAFVRIFPDCLSDVLLKIFLIIKSQWDFMMGKTRNSTLRLSWPTYGRRGTRAQKNSDSWCGVFKSDRNQNNSRSLYKTTPPTFEKRFCWNCKYQKGTKADLENASMSASLKVLHWYPCLRCSWAYLQNIYGV